MPETITNKDVRALMNHPYPILSVSRNDILYTYRYDDEKNYNEKTKAIEDMSEQSMEVLVSVLEVIMEEELDDHLRDIFEQYGITKTD